MSVTCIHCRKAISEGKYVKGGHHAPTMAKCDWHPKHREVNGPYTVEACKALFSELLISTLRLGRAQGTEAHESRAWIKRRSGDVGSFVWCCDLFNLDPDVVRERERRRWPASARRAAA